MVIRGFLAIAALDLAVIAVVAGLGWWAGWTELEDFQTAIQVAGLLLIGLGLLGIKGNPDLGRGVKTRTSMSGANRDGWDWSLQTLPNLARRYSFMLVMFFAGGVCLLIGWLM